jgi:CheY-like chemotaxis protein
MSDAIADNRQAGAAQPVVLVVDDEPDLLELVSLTLNRMNLRTRTAADVASARKLLKAERFPWPSSLPTVTSSPRCGR